ncbi:MAG: GGDEF domain-containing protein [Deltaproteobacteria bacterium]|nr:MAG: GGDEF domain-containing protein [Deltaproteobacteria bacterium]
MSRGRHRGLVVDAQLIHLGVVIAVLLGGAAWLGVEAQGQILWPDTIRGELRLLDRHLLDASAGANDFVTTREDGDWARYQHAVLSLREGAARLGVEQPAVAGEATALVDGIDGMMAAAEEIHDGATLDDRLVAMRHFDEQVAVVADLLGTVDASAAALLARQHFGRLARAGGLMVALAVYVGLAGIFVRRRWNAMLVARVEEARRTLGRNVVALQRAREGRELPPPSNSDFVAPLETEVDAVATLIAELRAAAEEDGRWVRFRQDLEAALDLADDEPEIYRIARKASEIAFPGSSFQLWLADHSFSELVPRCGDRDVLCHPERPTSCPAVRRSDITEHSPGRSLARCPHLVDDSAAATCAFVPIGGRSQGAIQVGRVDLNDRQLGVLRHIASAVGARLSAVRALGRSELQARTDVLTGLANRRAMNQRLADLERRAVPYAVIAADLDHFKRLNDTFGHEVGDRCLKVFAQVLRDSIRDTDLACRPGGEEFTVILPQVGLEAARQRAEEIRRRVEEASRGMGTGFTASLGVAVSPLHGDTAESVLRAADEALYAAKEAGRNRVEVYRAPRVLEEAS